MTGGGGVQRLARRALAEAQALDVPALPDPDAEPMGPLAFARASGYEPDLWQAAVLESDAQKHLLLCSRQAGKSQCAAWLAAHEAAFTPGALVLMLAPSLRQSSELFRRARGVLRAVGDLAPAVLEESVLRVELENGARIIALPGSGDTVRGYSGCSLLVVDEASRVSDELIAATRPSQATRAGARLVALSTPAGRRGWFWREWSQGEGWERTRVPAADCPRIAPAFLADERRQLGEFVYSQEYELAFLDPETSVFSSALIERALHTDVLPFRWSDA